MTAVEVAVNAMQAVALAAYDAGLCALRVRTDGSKTPVAVRGKGKVDPATGERRWGWHAYCEERPSRSEVEQWFADGHPALGVVCGAVSGGLEMLELEGRAVADGMMPKIKDAMAAAGLADLWTRVVHGYCEQTPSGGLHILYRTSGEVPGNMKLARRSATAEELAADPSDTIKVLLETRGEGGQVVIAPSSGNVHPSGKPWRLLRGGFLSIVTITEAERDALIAVCRQFDDLDNGDGCCVALPPVADADRSQLLPFAGRGIGDSWMDAVEAHLAAATTMRAVLEQYGWTHSHDAGGRSYMTRPGKDEGVSASINASDRVVVFSTSTPLLAYSGVGLAPSHSMSDVIAAYEYGGDREAAMRAIAEQTGIHAVWRAEQNPSSLVARTPPVGMDPETGEVRGTLEVPISWSDAHVGEAFGVTLRGRWLYCRALGGWLQWDGRRWRVDPGEAVFEEFRRWIIELGEQLWRIDGDAEVMKKVARYRDRGKIDAAVTIARRLDFVAARHDEFDTHPHLLNCLNGVVDLRTGAPQPHDPALRLRQLAGAAYVPDAVHRDFEAVLETMGSDVQPWVQRLVGSSAFGSVVDDIVAVFDGNGANGKTTALKAFANALGDYATSASTRLLIARAAHDDHPTLIADLFGRRLVYIEETPEGGALKMEQLKALSGGTEIKARFIGKDQFSFVPTHQFIIATNHRPAVNASDYAAWRRLRLVPFPHTYRKPYEARPGDRVADLGLRSRLSHTAQREAALAWIVAGAVAWHRDGLGGCASIDEATDSWRRAEDVIEAWWADSIVVAADGTLPATRIYESFTEWCRHNGRPAASNKEFVKKLMDHDLYQRHRIERRDGRMGRIYAGLKLASEGF
ncbi:MAG: phage/plasmid primase, P4 family [Acidimicrobiia bacterium]